MSKNKKSLNYCNNCQAITKNNKYCSIACRDISKKKTTYTTTVCKHCNKEFVSRIKQNKKYCSVTCSGSAIGRDSIHNMKKVLQQKYKVEHPSHIPDVLEKIKKTVRKKYKVDYITQSEEFKEKSKISMLKKYNVEYPMQSVDIREKQKNTVAAKYNGYTLASPILSEKVKRTNLEKYKVEHYINFDAIKSTNLEQYNVEFPLQSPTIQQKIKTTLKNKYNVKNVSQIPEISEKVKKSIWENTYDRLTTLEKYTTRVIPLFSKKEYIGSLGKYKFQCIQCKTEFFHAIKNGIVPRCHICYPVLQHASKIEDEICAYIQSLNSSFRICKNDRTVISNELDLYIPSKQIAIEVNGIYWHSEQYIDAPEYHIKKTQECLDKNIRLLHIFDTEWINSKEIIQSILQTALVPEKNTKIFARKCIVQEITSKQAKDFLERNHLQAHTPAKIKLGLFYNNELVQVMTFSKSRYDKLIEYEMIRHATKLYHTVIGGLEKLWKYFVTTYDPTSVISYADRRLFTGKSYERLKFKFSGYTPINYYYFTPNKTLENRLKYQKHKLKDVLPIFDNTLTEHENMNLNNYWKVWDCGNSKYLWIKEKPPTE